MAGGGATLREQREDRSSIGRQAAFGLIGVVVSVAISGLPSDAIMPALLGLAILGLGGGSLARSRREIDALVAGGVAGAFGFGILTLGKPNGPSSVASFIFGVIVVAVILGVLAVGSFALRAGLGQSRSPHGDPDLEGLLPLSVAGRPLERWSVSGAGYPFLRVLGIQGDIRAVDGRLKAIGLLPRDVSFAFAGRSSPEEPPKSIIVHRYRGVPIGTVRQVLELKVGFGVVDDPEIDDWTEVEIAGRHVLRGVDAMIMQTEHARGVPYVYDVRDLHFAIVTDDEGWADEALRLLPQASTGGEPMARPA
jgi:hypothetical protein